MFSEAVFTRGVILAFLSSVGLLGTTFLLPLFFQLIRGADASASGLLLMPFLVFTVIGAYLGGQFARRLGRTKGLLVAGFAAASVGFAGLALTGPDSATAFVVLAMALNGIGIGSCMPNVLVMVQNSAELRDVGTATGALLFLRSMGGAFGSTLVGALLTGVFASRLAVAGFPGVADLGAMKPDGSLAALGPAAQAAGRAALGAGFHMAFGACLALFLVAVLVALGLRDIPLRSVSGTAPQEPAALGH